MKQEAYGRINGFDVVALAEDWLRMQEARKATQVAVGHLAVVIQSILADPRDDDEATLRIALSEALATVGPSAPAPRSQTEEEKP